MLKSRSLAACLTFAVACALLCAPGAPAQGSAKAPSSAAGKAKAGRQAGKQPEAGPAKAAGPVEVSEVDEAALAKLIRRDAPRRTPLLVNFWATWCDPCREEFPDLVKVDADYRARGLEFVTVSLDDASEINNAVPRFIEKMGANRIPAYLLNASEPETAIAAIDKEWRGELPATFLFDREGKLVYRHTGRVKPKELRAAIDKALAAKASAPPSGAK